ncbi:50S ribosomal protein L2 [Candidatus Similichlamydia laticola]|uniref:Large ribosomal subunit protein uL2 n=1 Tax=Candidatus Similichlamydia laticola TaxID=2170265 RepID=A0A369K9W2_9BACT|nr:50S ribosomal protein L2 [Candidatus Similichlamydia laticola]RDB31381.1 LSU ribosomal protein L2p (L8e) [Candidatus Similichlamydia laticola]
MIKKFRPLTPCSRFLTLESRDGLATSSEKDGVKRPKYLRRIKHSTGGRNNCGRITCRHRGGGHKRFYRLIDFVRMKDDVPARVVAIEYDPNRSARIALLFYKDGEKRYILAPSGLVVGQTVLSGKGAPYRPGSCMSFRDMPVGSLVHNIEMVPGRGGKLVRSAGSSAQFMGCSDGYARVRLPSGEVRRICESCRATIGSLSNAEHSLRVEGKAGRRRWLGIRPSVRGTAMNPVDHPHGGGEGKHNGYIPMTPWAMQTKGLRTRKKRKSSKFIIRDRRG